MFIQLYPIQKHNKKYSIRHNEKLVQITTTIQIINNTIHKFPADISPRPSISTGARPTNIHVIIYTNVRKKIEDNRKRRREK